MIFLKHIIKDIDPAEILLILDNIPMHQAYIILKWINDIRLTEFFFFRTGTNWYCKLFWGKKYGRNWTERPT